MVLTFSVFLPMLASVSRADSMPDHEEIGEEDLREALDQDPELQGWVSDVKEVQPADIWHSEVPEEDYDKGPFTTDTATVHLNLTGEGDKTAELDPFDWVFSIDSSGSMMDYDPQRHRVSGAQLFVDRVRENYSELPPDDRARGSTIDFDSEATKFHELTDNYYRIHNDLEQVDQRGGTNFHDPMGEALEEFEVNGYEERNWYHLFLTDGQHLEDSYPDYWPLVEEHGRRDIPIFAIGFGAIDHSDLQRMADITDGEYYFVEETEDLHDVFADIFDEVSTTTEVAAESPPDDMMIKEKLPSHLEYVEDSLEVEATPATHLDIDTTVEEDGRNTILKFEPDRDGENLVNIGDEIRISYEVKSSTYSHNLPLTAYDGEIPESKIQYYNRTTGDIDTIHTEGPGLNVHGIPEPVVGAEPRWDGLSVGQTVIFQNRSGNELTTWPGDCIPENYTWEVRGQKYEDSGEEGEAADEHRFRSAGVHDVKMTAKTHCGVEATVVRPVSITGAPPQPPPPPPPTSPPPPGGMGIASPTATPVQLGIGNPMATPTPTGVPQPTAMPQVSMQPIATSQPVGMPTTTAIFAGFMPVAAQKNPAEKIKMSVSNLN